MSSPGQWSNEAVPNPTVMARPNLVDEGHESEQAISAALAGLDDVRRLPVSEHVERFEAVHAALTDALSKAENVSSSPNGYGS